MGLPTKTNERPLTPGEETLAKKMFKHSIAYSKVKIHHEKYIFFQPSNSGMTPNGEIYIDGVYKNDYSLEAYSLRIFFIHEIAHVWQYQNNVLSPIWSAIGDFFEESFNYNNAYKYKLDKGKDLVDYDIEQQASIIEDYYRIVHEKKHPVKGHLQNTEGLAKLIPLYKAGLSKFLINPGYAKHK